MNKRPYPYYSPHIYTPENYGFYYNTHGNPYYPAPHYPLQQVPVSPYEYYAKPSQPPIWPNEFMSNQSMTNPSAYNQQQSSPPVNNDFTSSMMSNFQDSSGKVDVNKMLSTVGQLADTVQQVSPVIKQVGSIIKQFR